MSALHVRDVDDATIQRLKLRAESNHRSLQGELKTILEEASLPPRGKARRRPLKIHQVAVGAANTYSRDEIYADEKGDKKRRRAAR